MTGSPTKSYIASRLLYNRKTGVFLWKDATKHHGNLVGKIAGCIVCNKGKSYLRIKVDKVSYGAHRLAWLYVYGKWPKSIDHINGNSLDNSIKNLRECTQAENTQNHLKRRNNSGLPIGVRATKSGKFQARITTNKSTLHLGTFSTIGMAFGVYEKAKKKLHYCPARKSYD